MGVQEAANGDEPDTFELRTSLRDEVNRLPEKYRRPIELCYWEGLNSEQAAERLECPTGTLKWRLLRAREILRNRLGRAGLAGLMLLMGKSSIAQSAAFRPQNEGRGPAFEGGDEPSAKFVEDALAMAEFVRDFSTLSKLDKPAASVTKNQITRGIAVTTTVLMIAAVLSSIFYECLGPR